MSEQTPEKRAREASRRRFLQAGAALAGGSAIGGLSGTGAVADLAGSETSNLPPTRPEWMKAPGDPMGNEPYGAPSPFEKGVVKNISKTLPQYISAAGRTPLQDLD